MGSVPLGVTIFEQCKCLVRFVLGEVLDQLANPHSVSLRDLDQLANLHSDTLRDLAHLPWYGEV